MYFGYGNCLDEEEKVLVCLHADHVSFSVLDYDITEDGYDHIAKERSVQELKSKVSSPFLDYEPVYKTILQMYDAETRKIFGS
jgi:hypothetical protein